MRYNKMITSIESSQARDEDRYSQKASTHPEQRMPLNGGKGRKEKHTQISLNQRKDNM